MAGKSATEFDKLLGERIRQFRLKSNVSRTDVAKALGVTQTQLAKYEDGVNCLKANAMPALASLFGKKINDFFECDPVPGNIAATAEKVPAILSDAVSDLHNIVDRIDQAANVLKSTFEKIPADRKG